MRRTVMGREVVVEDKMVDVIVGAVIKQEQALLILLGWYWYR